MLGLGWTEMLVIGVVALIFIGPKDLPVVMGRIGKVVGQIRRMGNEFQREINRTTGLDEVRNLRNSITSPLKKTADEIRKDFNAMSATGKQEPTGAIKPSDPKVESVVDTLRDKAGMEPAKKSNDELAGEYGFKPATPVGQPVKAAQVTPKPAVAAPTSPVTSADLPAVEPVVEKAPEKVTVRKGAAKRETLPAVATEEAAALPAKTTVRKSRAKTPAIVEATADAGIAKPKKPRAPRKKPDEAAGTN